MNISLDFDDTLDRGDVQHFAKMLIKAYPNLNISIVTSRLCDDKAPSDNWNNDLYFVAKQLCIKNIVFTNYSHKYEYFWAKDDYLFHLDDDKEEVRMINAMCDNTKAIDVNKENWKDKIKTILDNARLQNTLPT